MNDLTEWVVMPLDHIIFVALSVLGAYFALILFTRLAGIRSFSKMSGFDFAITVSIGSVFAATIVAKTPPLGQGIIALAILFICQICFATLRAKFDIVRQFSDNTPRLIMIGDTIQHDQLSKSKMTESDLMAKLREANVANLSQVKAVIAETTGDVSVIHHNEEFSLSACLLNGVEGADRYPQSSIE